MVWAVVASLAGAFCYAVAAVLQQREAADAPAQVVGRPALLWHLVRRPRWLLGVAAALAGAGLHITALAWGPLVMVQPLGAASPMFAIFLRSAWFGGRPTRRDLLGACAVCAGLGLLLAAVRPDQETPTVGLAAVASLAILGGAIVALLLAAGLWTRGAGRALVLAVGAGFAFGLVSVLVRVLITDMSTTSAAAIAGWAGIGVAVFAVVGQLQLQTAYNTGRLALVLAAVTVVDPLTASAVGIAWLHEGAAVTAPELAIAGATLIISGVFVLARSASGTAPVQAVQPRQEVRPPAAVLRVLIGTDTYPPHINGSAVFARRLAHGLAESGHEVHVLCAGASRRDTIEFDGRIAVHRLASRLVPGREDLSYCPPWQVGSATARIVEQISPDVIHIQSHYLIGRALTRLAPAAGIPVVATNHFMPDNLLAQVRLPSFAKRGIARWAWRDCIRVLDRADAVTTPTPIAASLLQDMGLHQDVSAISCGIDLRRFTTRSFGGHRSFELPDRPTILFVGRLDPDKRIIDVIDALPIVRRRVDAQLVIVGIGTQAAELERRARRNGVAEHTHFLGFVPDPALPSAYAVADVFCMPGVAELQSLVTLEAMATGLPVVAADAVALPHLVRNGQNGWRYPPGDVAMLADRLAAVLIEPDLARTMGSTSRLIAVEHDSSRSIQRFESLYRDLIAATVDTPT